MAAKKKSASTASKTQRGPVEIDRSLSFGSVRLYSDWTISKIKAAERSAEAGDLRQAVAICEWLLTDDRIAGALDARIDALLGLVPTFEPGIGRARKTNRAIKALEADEDWWDAYPERELRQFVKWGLLLGVCPGRHNWTERADHGGRMLPMPRYWHPQTLRWNWHYGGDDQAGHWSIRDITGVEHILTPGDGEWILHTPYGSMRPWSDGLWRSLARWALIKDLAQRDGSRHSETGAQRVVNTPEGVTSEQRKEIARAVREAGADPVFALPPGFSVEMLETRANLKDMYLALVEAADLAISIRIRGGNLSTNVQGGSRAAAEQQVKQNEIPKLKFDAESLSTTLHDQSLKWWALFNFGDERLAPWPVWPVEPEEDKEKRAAVFKTIGEGLAAWHKQGYKIDLQKLTEDFGFSFVVGREEPEPAPQPAPPKEGAQGGEDGEADADRGRGADRAENGGMRARMGAMKLASGASLAENSGFLDGQLYCDDLADVTCGKAGEALSASLLDDLRETVRKAKSYEEVRAAVLAKYRDAGSPEKLRELTKAALMMAEMAGAAAVRQDVPEVS